MTKLRIDFIKRIQSLQKCLLEWRLSKVQQNLELKENPNAKELEECQFKKWLDTHGKICLSEEVFNKLEKLEKRMINIEANIERKKKNLPESSLWNNFFSTNLRTTKEQIFAYHKDLRNVSTEILQILKDLEVKWLGESDKQFNSDLQERIVNKNKV
jgi:hypothetical protein